MLRLRILQKGFAVIAIPLVLQILFVLQLYGLAEESEALTNKQRRAAKIADLSSQILMMVGEGFAIAITERSTGRAYKGAADAFWAKTSQLFQEARATIGNDGRERLIFAEGELVARREYAVLKEIEDQMEGPEGLLKKFQALAKLEPILHEITPRLKKLRHQLELRRMAAEEAARAEAKARDNLQQGILWGIGFELVLTILVLALFLQDMTKRMALLVKNAEQIPSGQALTNKVSGSDELAYLDQVLHKAAADLRAAAVYRKSVTQMIAHDLRTPLMTAQLLIERLEHNPANVDGSLTNELAVLKKNQAQLISFIEDLLTLDRLEEGKLPLEVAELDLSDLLREGIERIRPLANAKDIQVGEQLLSAVVFADGIRILQVVNNLLSNAVKFSPIGSCITVFTRLEDGFACAEIQDFGPGVSESSKTRIFEKFSQSTDTDSQRGFGLGLFISKLIISEHGGRIGVTSDGKLGSTFWFTLPREVEHIESDSL